MITREQFGQIMRHGESAGRLDAHWPYINPALVWGEITTPVRVAAFMAQLALESGEYRYMEEIASGDAYEGRVDLGNTEPGDGRRFKGHGPIQITGRTNHRNCGAALGLDLIGAPTLLTLPEHGTRSAVWFWSKYARLNDEADQNTEDSFREITRRINGGYNGLAERLRYWDLAKRVMGVADAPAGPRVLRRGMQGDDVRALQEALSRASVLPFSLKADGIFGAGTEEHLIAYQQAHGLAADGIAGPKTREALGLARTLQTQEA